MATTPVLLTMGDACGIGPEIILKAVAGGAAADCLAVADPQVLLRAAAALGLTLPLAQIDTPADLASVPPGALGVLRPPQLPAGLHQLPWGRIDARCGAAAARCIDTAVQWLRGGQAAAMVTAPLHKEALAAAGIGYPGHTEMLQALAAPALGEPPPVRMMLANDELRVVLVSIHVSLRQAIERVTFQAVSETIRITADSLQRMLGRAPRLLVAGLNPHAGEGGLFGDEELRVIAPAIQAAQAAGLDVRGPLAPDTVFMQARQSRLGAQPVDAVIAMYHDQGLIPVKYLGVEEGVNVTLGLPLVRTSPDHGTAFDIAGTGQASSASLLQAIRVARQLAASPA